MGPVSESIRQESQLTFLGKSRHSFFQKSLKIYTWNNSDLEQKAMVGLIKEDWEVYNIKSMSLSKNKEKKKETSKISYFKFLHLHANTSILLSLLFWGTSWRYLFLHLRGTSPTLLLPASASPRAVCILISRKAEHNPSQHFTAIASLSSSPPSQAE